MKIGSLFAGIGGIELGFKKAGFNASSVDVRSSRYDAIVDYNGTLLRIQIKGITGGLISFKDRDRGG
ncbi:DNA cytosine methyltransferase, partial [Campylobacter upsaliensis]|uniref:DNA cytosine methyltransferase n=1 Tax=Campylobacter upsaliensis TaxID=28080 RepID=UPI002149B264